MKQLDASDSHAELDLSVPRASRLTLWRRTKITLGLSLFGAACGAFAGGLTAMLAGGSIDPFLFVIGGEFGAPLGAILFPVAGWTLLRRVSFARAFVGSVLGTSIGGAIGWIAPIGQNDIQRSLVFGFLGFLIAVIIMRRGAMSAATRAVRGDVD